jgi:hypothetical protein
LQTPVQLPIAWICRAIVVGGSTSFNVRMNVTNFVKKSGFSVIHCWGMRSGRNSTVWFVGFLRMPDKNSGLKRTFCPNFKIWGLGSTQMRAN